MVRSRSCVNGGSCTISEDQTSKIKERGEKMVLLCWDSTVQTPQYRSPHTLISLEVGWLRGMHHIRTDLDN